ncbi:MAG: hypothetical protein WKF30_05215 [Pyrinomonadaceae bacterium]
MADEQNSQKQSGDQDATQTAREGFTAEELGQASIYDDSTQIAQQMRRGDESQGDPNERDVVGATDVKNTNEARQDQDTTAAKNEPA